MVDPFTHARDELKRKLEKLFSQEVYSKLYSYEVPKISDGFPVNEPPYYVAIDEIVDTAQTTGAATIGHAEISFDLNVYVCAHHADLMTAANTLMSYISVIFDGQLADHTLNRAVDNSTVSITTAGTASDSSKRYLAAAQIAINCTIFSRCPKEIKEAVDGLCS